MIAANPWRALPQGPLSLGVSASVQKSPLSSSGLSVQSAPIFEPHYTAIYYFPIGKFEFLYLSSNLVAMKLLPVSDRAWYQPVQGPKVGDLSHHQLAQCLGGGDPPVRRQSRSLATLASQVVSPLLPRQKRLLGGIITNVKSPTSLQPNTSVCSGMGHPLASSYKGPF